MPTAPETAPQTTPQTTLKTAKQEALTLISHLPDTTTIEEMMYELYVLEKIRKGKEDIEQGKSISADDLDKEIETW